MKRQDLFKKNTEIVDTEENPTIKKANINVRGVPRLEVHGKSKKLSNKAFGIGRDRTNGIIIADPKVSKFHALVTFEKGEGYIKDSNSTNGTYINGKRITAGKRVKLKDGDKIKVGSTCINYYIS